MGIHEKVGIFGGSEEMIDDQKNALLANGHEVVYSEENASRAVQGGGIATAVEAGMSVALINPNDQAGDFMAGDDVAAQVIRVAPHVGVIAHNGHGSGMHHDLYVRKSFSNDSARVAEAVTHLQTPIRR